MRRELNYSLRDHPHNRTGLAGGTRLEGECTDAARDIARYGDVNSLFFPRVPQTHPKEVINMDQKNFDTSDKVLVPSVHLTFCTHISRTQPPPPPTTRRSNRAPTAMPRFPSPFADMCKPHLLTLSVALKASHATVMRRVIVSSS